MTQKSFTKGSAFPPLTPGKLRLYSMRFCPYAQRTRLVLECKNIPFETINIDLKNKPDWFLARNPLGLVPVLEIDDKIVYESTATCEWLDDIYPENKLQPSDPYLKAKDRILLEYYGKFTTALYAMRRAEKREEAVENVMSRVDFYEKALAERGGPFFGGKKPSMIDYYIWPHMERLPVVLPPADPKCGVDRTKLPKMAEWFEHMYETPEVKATMFDAESHLHFIHTFALGNPDYDFGLEE